MKLRICICLFVTSVLLAGVASAWYLSGGMEDRIHRSIEKDSISALEKESSFTGDSDRNQREPAYPELPVSEAFYYVTLQDNEVIAYTGDHRKICLQTRIDREELADGLIYQLQQGIYVENLPALYEYLENCSS